MKLYCNAENPRAFKILIAAKYVGAEVELAPFNPDVDGKSPEFLAKSPAGKVPVIDTPEGALYESNAIARYIARLPNSTIYGSTPFETALIDQWVEFCSNEIDLPTSAWVLPILGVMPDNTVATKKAKSDVRMVLRLLNAHLLTRTFFVGERVTLADVAVCCSLLPLYKLVLDPGFRKEFTNVNRWFTTCVHQPHFAAVLGDVLLCTKMQVAPAEPKKEVVAAEPKKEVAPAPKKEPKKEEAEEADVVEEAPKKAPNPLDLLPKSPLVMDEWKRMYSNNDTREVAMPWFWEHFDSEGYSLWFSKYKFEVEASQLFVVCNSVGGFLQRLDRVRKYGFGSVCIFNDAKPFEICGVWLFRGLEVPAEMKECDDYELYTWEKLSKDNAEHKELVEDYFAWDGKLGGMKFNQGKIFK